MRSLCRIGAVLVAAFGLSSTSACAEVTIVAPSEVCYRELISGTTANNKPVFVVIHPLAVATYFIQERVSVDNEHWQLLGYFGKPAKNVGEYFEIRAFVSPGKEAPHSGAELSDWPNLTPSSNLVTVKRKNC